jgi:hypothetical protein
VSDTSEPAVPLLAAPANQLMALSNALRQASADIPKDLPPGVRFAYVTEEGAGGALVVTVKAKVPGTDKDASAFVLWEQGYDGRGRRITVGGGIDF